MQNYRYDEFLDLASPVLVQETIKVPSSSPYYVALQELPLQSTPSTILVRDAAATSSQNPDQDCAVNQNNPTSNDNTGGLVAGRTSMAGGVGGWIYRSFLRFNISGLPSSPQKVLLRLYVNAVVGDSLTQTLGIYQVTSSWTETGPTWNSQPTIDPTPVGAMTIQPWEDGKAAGYSGWYECDITALYNTWKAGTNYGLCIKGDESLYSYVSMVSKDAIGTTTPPTLVVINSGALYTQVGQTIAPAAKEFAAAYSTGRLRFHSAAAGLTLNVDYQGLGSPIDCQDVGVRAPATAGTSTAYTINNSARISLVALLVVYFKPHTTCGANPTLNMDGTGAKALQIKGANVTAGQLQSGIPYIAIYDGTAYQVIGA